MGHPVVHFEVMGKDGGKLREFYSNMFGWDMQVMPELDYGTVDNGGQGVNGGIGTGEQPHATFYVAVDDPQAHLDKIEAAGGKTTVPVTEIPGVVTFARFTDPEGNLVGLLKSDAS